MQAIANEVLAPPPGFRKAIPVSVKFDAVIRGEGRCKACGEMLVGWTSTQFDHVPAIQLRAWDPVEEDTIPASNDPDHIHAKHKDCHGAKTTGRKGESKLNAIGGDVSQVAKLKRVTKSEIEFRRRLLSKGEEPLEEEQPKSKPKSRWPSRPFNRGGKRGPSSQGPQGSAEGHDAH